MLIKWFLRNVSHPNVIYFINPFEQIYDGYVLKPELANLRPYRWSIFKPVQIYVPFCLNVLNLEQKARTQKYKLAPVTCWSVKQILTVRCKANIWLWVFTCQQIGKNKYTLSGSLESSY